MAPPNLLTIPVELRELIYGFLFSSYTIFHGQQRLSKPVLEAASSPRAALLLTCRQIHAEAWPHLPLNCTLHFRGTEDLLDTLLSVDQSIVTRLRRIRVRAFPFPLYADDGAEYYPTYYFANALSLLPGLCLDELEVYDCWHGYGQGDGWRDVTTYMDFEALLKSDAWKRLTYITPCTDFIASGYDHRRKRRQQPETWDAMLKEREGDASDASVKMWIVPVKQNESRDEDRTEDGRKMQEWSALPGHEVIGYKLLASPEQDLKGEVRIVATRGKRARVVQLGLQEKASWREVKGHGRSFMREGKILLTESRRQLMKLQIGHPITTIWLMRWGGFTEATEGDHSLLTKRCIAEWCATRVGFDRQVQTSEGVRAPYPITCRERATTLHNINIPRLEGAALEPFEEQVAQTQAQIELRCDTCVALRATLEGADPASAPAVPAETGTPAPAAAGHRRNKSTSVLKSIIGQHKRSPSDGTALKAAPSTAPYIPMPSTTMDAPILPPDHPHSQLRPANQFENLTLLPPSPRKQSHDPRSSSPKKGLHKKTLSTVSLRSLGKDKTKEKQSFDLRQSQEEETVHEHSKKVKSSTNLASMFGKSKSRKVGWSPSKDKENTAPFSPAVASEPPATPIWAQFSSQPLQEIAITNKVSLNDRGCSVEDDMSLHTPQNYSPSKQRDFFELGQPTLQNRPSPKERPKSMHIPKSTTSLLGTFSRKKSTDRAPLTNAQGNGERTRDSSPSKGKSTRPALERASTDIGRQPIGNGAADPPLSPTKKPNRVMAAVAAFNGKAKQTDAPLASPTKELDPKVVDAEFEEVLESRNIPTHQRAAMRTLKIEVKADFVRTHKLDTPRLSTASIPSLGEGEEKAKLQPPKSTKSRNDSAQEEVLTLQASKADGTKRERPTSKTFTFNRSNSPTKKQRATELGATTKHTSPIPKSPSTRSLVSDAASNRSVSNSSKTVKSTEFINYLKKNPKPQDVEVGKLHKLRLLLRNETVEWVDTFIQDGGMLELVALLHRIMEIEWREDHEDTLLHELLRCLKGLCTTDSALKQLASISSSLYPALIEMLFDEEHKGPSEFTTRELVFQIIFAHIDMAPESELATRATELLAYLRDPVKEKESSTIPFILQMHTSRPYQVWCKEMTNVTKEVFWIFIHHLNVVPIPSAPSAETAAKSYAKKHFPGPRAIVPAAPYVGGVEWDATNYLATHIDLLNGLLASLPTREARNELRENFRISGFEKLMGQLRACNPKYYGAVHDSIKVWVGAALEDDWDVKPVRMGSGDKNNSSTSPAKMSPKKKAEPAPQIDVPKLDLGLAFDREIDIGGPVGGKKDDDWI
ncbi:hypothetical protein OPT61_g3401 [Boeremia exigua]|uniref:Uncharacterized protein n=1 Tax=Boeremia exigua TaxID=749465 RepID=A0ACC2II32_9PLEO|nr:hypothetical protein OPT61_g3401 [Boeremia exigua]